MSLESLDRQMSVWTDRLVSEVEVSLDDSRMLATAIARDVRFLPMGLKSEIKQASPVSLKDRREELVGFQTWMDEVRGTKHPPTVRAQVLAGNYICFVYLPESFFRIFAKTAPSKSALKCCSFFLTNGRIRAFRNAIAHSNWRYREDFGALVYWAKKGQAADEPLSMFEVENSELSFWQMLSRCVAYAAVLNLE